MGEKTTVSFHAISLIGNGLNYAEISFFFYNIKIQIKSLLNDIFLIWNVI